MNKDLYFFVNLLGLLGKVMKSLADTEKTSTGQKVISGSDVCSKCIYRWMPYKGKLAFNRYCTHQGYY